MTTTPTPQGAPIEREIVLPELPEAYIAARNTFTPYNSGDMESYARTAILADREAGRSAPVAWVDGRNLVSARISHERGGPFDSHVWSEGKTAIHDTPLYAGSAPVVEPVASAVAALACSVQKLIEVHDDPDGEWDDTLNFVGRDLREAFRKFTAHAPSSAPSAEENAA